MSLFWGVARDARAPVERYSRSARLVVRIKRELQRLNVERKTDGVSNPFAAGADHLAFTSQPL
jgi:hypothetical protein